MPENQTIKPELFTDTDEIYTPNAQAFSRPPADHEVYNLVGRVSSEWAHLEHMLDLIIWDLAGLEPAKGACINAQLMGVWPRIYSIVALLTFHKKSIPSFEATIKTINVFGADCRGPSERRNRIIHDPWYSEQHDEKIIAQRRSMPKGKLTYELKEIDKVEITDLLTEIARLSERATKLKNDISAMLSASQ